MMNCEGSVSSHGLCDNAEDTHSLSLALGPKALTEAELQASPFAAWEAQNAVEPIYGRACTMAAHATRCHNLDPERVKSIVAEVARLQDVEKRAKELKAGGAHRLGENTPPRPGPPGSGGPSSSHVPASAHSGAPAQGRHSIQAAGRIVYTPGETHIWDDAGQRQWAKDTIKMLLSCGVSWRAVDDDVFQAWVMKYIGLDVQIPDRRALSGAILDELYHEVLEEMGKSVENRLAVGQSDGWKNVAKTNVTSTLMSVDQEVST